MDGDKLYAHNLRIRDVKRAHLTELLSLYEGVSEAQAKYDLVSEPITALDKAVKSKRCEVEGRSK